MNCLYCSGSGRVRNGDPDMALSSPAYDWIECPVCKGTGKSHLKQRPEDQPLPVVNDKPFIHDIVSQDIQGRKALGIKRYGTALQPHNGRDGLRDAYEELLDAACYIRNLMYERDGK